MSKTKWYTKLIYTTVAVALVLSFGLVAAPAAAEGAAAVTLNTGGPDGKAEWSTTYAKSGSYSVKLSAPATTGDYGRVIMPLDMAFADLENFSVWVEGGAATQALPLLDIKAVVEEVSILPASNKGDGAGVDLAGKIVVLASQPGQNEGLSLTLMSDGNVGWQLYGTHDDAVIKVSGDVATEAYWSIFVYSAEYVFENVVYDYYTWEQIHTALDGHATVTEVRVELGYPQDPDDVASTVYVDDIVINTDTYALEALAIDASCYKIGETVHVTMYNSFGTAETYAAWAYSDTVGEGGKIAVGLANQYDGTFTGSFTTSSTGTGLLVTDGGRIYVKARSDWGTGWADLVWVNFAVVDKTNPAVNITAPAPSSYWNETKEISADVTDANPFSATIAINGAVEETGTSSPVTYAWVTTGETDGVYTILVTATDCAGNESSQSRTVTVDNTKPSVTIIQATAQADPANTSPINFVAHFSEVVTGFEAGDVTISGDAGGATTATVTALEGGEVGKDYNVAVTGMTGDGTVIVDIAADTAIDAAGNGNTASTSTDDTVTWDQTHPTVTLTSSTVAQGATTDVSPEQFTATFSETVTGFVADDIEVSGTSAVTNFVAVSGTEYTFDIIPGGTGDPFAVTVDIAADTAIDAATNGNIAATQYSYTFDVVNPTCTLATAAPDPFNTATFTVTATFSATVTGFTVDDITVGNGTKGAFTAVSGLVYTLVITPDDQGAVTADVDAGVCIDEVLRPNLAAEQLSKTFDSVAPTCVLTAPCTSVATFDLIITFSEPVVDFDAADVAVTNATKGAFAGPSDNAYTLSLTVIESASPVIADVAAGVCTDWTDGNANLASNHLSVCHSVNGIDLAAGWNLMSPNLIPNNTDIGTVLTAISADVVAVWYYDPTIEVEDLSSRWLSWQDVMPSPTLTTINDGKAYWINMAAAHTLIIDGVEFKEAPATPPAYSVLTGWNMVGFKSLGSMEVQGYLNSVAGDYTRVYYYNTTTGRYTSIWGTDEMDPGQGFWISFTANGTIYP